jgi:hypothetical protein
VRSLPPARRSAPDFGMVLALAARDSGNERLAREILGQVLRAGARPEYARLESTPLAKWPATLHEAQLPRAREAGDELRR